MENLNAPQELSPSGSYFTVNLKKHGKVGFGFEITGGQEHGTQVVISRIVRLGPAEGCLQVGDEIQYVNEVKVIGATGDRVIMLVKTAESLGEVNLGIYRNLARMEHTMYVVTSSTLPQQRYAPVELPNSSSKDPNYHYGIPAQRNSGDAGTKERISQGMQCSMPGTPQMNAATALAPGEATLQSQNMPESRPLSRWSDPSDSVHRQCDRAEVDDWMASGPSPHEDLDIVYTYLHSESGKDDLPELQNFEDIEPMDTSQPMNTKPSGDESGSSDPSDSGYGQSDRVEERSQEEIPSVPSGACPPVRLEVREVESSVKKIVPDSSPLEGG